MSHLRLRPRGVTGPVTPLRLLAVLVVALAAFVYAPIGSAASTTLVINEVDYDQPSTDTAEFFEIKNVSSGPVNLDAYRVEGVNGAGGGTAVYRTVDLPNVDLAAGDYFVVGPKPPQVPNCHFDVTAATQLFRTASRTRAPPEQDHRGSTCSPTAATRPATPRGPAPPDEGNATADEGLSRCADGTDTDQNSVDFSLRPISPGATNSCPGTPPPNQGVTVTCGALR